MVWRSLTLHLGVRLMVNEYQAQHGHGSGWSWDVAKASRGKISDMIDAQGAGWELDIAIEKLASGNGPVRAFDPYFRRDRPKEVKCLPQLVEEEKRREGRGLDSGFKGSGTSAERVIEILATLVAGVVGKAPGRARSAVPGRGGLGV